MVDGSEIRRSPADMVSIHIIYHFRWWSPDFWSINSTSLGFLLWLFGIQKKKHLQKTKVFRRFFFRGCSVFLVIYGCFRKWGYPQIIHFYRIFHYFHHPFWGTLFLETSIYGWCSFLASTVDWPSKLATRWRLHGYFCFALLVIREVVFIATRASVGRLIA